MIEQALFEILKNAAGVAAIVGERITPNIATQGAPFPCIVYSLVNAQRQQTLCRTTGLVRGTYQIDCDAAKYITASQLAAAVRAALIDFSGTVSGTRVNRIFLDTEADLADPEPGLHRVSQTFVIWYLED